MRAAVLNSIDDGAERLLRIAMGLELEESDNFEAPQTAVKEEDSGMDEVPMVPIQTPLISHDGCSDLPESLLESTCKVTTTRKELIRNPKSRPEGRR